MKEITATAGTVWIADLLNYLQTTAANPTGDAAATVVQPYDYARQEFRAVPVRVHVRLRLDSRGRSMFYVFGRRVSYTRFWDAITA